MAALSEDELIARCARDLPSHPLVAVGSGDDCAVLIHPDQRSVISTDTLVEGTHFRRDWSKPSEVGLRAAVQNMADIAAMGARQHAAVMAVSCPADAQEWVTEMALAFRACIEENGAALVGGDITRSDQIVITVTVIGQLTGARPLLRSGAKVGDAIIFAGQQGWSAAGLEIISRGIDPNKVQPALTGALTRALQAFKAPTSPLKAGETAGQTPGVHALMDVSDGLVRDLGKICKASKVSAQLDSRLLAPLLGELAILSELGIDTQKCFFTGGEDHGLIGTCAPTSIPAGFTQIGSICQADSEQNLIRGIPDSLVEAPGGWDHFN